MTPVHISHPEREIFPDAKITKGQLADFYAELGDLIMPSVEFRPISIIRCPGGIAKECFFQRAKGKGMPKHIHTIDMHHKQKIYKYMYIRDLTGLLELVQMGSIEILPWGVKIDNPDQPDRIVFDLDPDEAVPFEAVKLAAQNLKNRLDELGLESFLKCTGGKGLHVTIPIVRKHGWNTVKTFARNLAQKMVDDIPEALTIHLAKKKRTGKIFIDYLRNDFSATAVMDYCVRARPGASVAVPLQWSELSNLKSANQFHLKEALARKKRGQKLLVEEQRVKQQLSAAILKECNVS